MSSRPTVDPPIAPPPVRLTRSRDDRMIAGVAGGIGHHLGVDPVLVRLVFVLLAFAGGGGVLAYLIAWIVVPEAPEEGSPSPAAAGSATGAGTSVLAGFVLVALGGILLIQRLVPAFSWRYVAPVLLIALGVLLVARKGELR
jgi:phage shock protein C